MQLALKVEIFRSGRSQKTIARACGMSEKRLSQIVHDWVAPRPHERKRLARVLGTSESELFTREVAS